MSRLREHLSPRSTARAFALVAFAVVACSEAEPDAPPAASQQGGTSGAPETPGAGTGGASGAPGSAGVEPDAAAPVAPVATCTPGEVRECQRDLLCTGAETCAADGLGFGPCECGAVPLEGGPGVVGARCQADADCAGGALCLRADEDIYLGRGGIAGGYCSFACSATADCESVDPESRCVPLGPDGSNYCIRTCLSKDPEPGEAKCLNRPDLACVSVASDPRSGIPFTAERQDGYCAPRCGSDEECPSGRICHRQSGLCTTFASPGAPPGSRCTLDADCDGQMCEDRIGIVGVCTATCVLGALSGCGYGADASPRDVACLTPLVVVNRFSEGAGDLGLCRELCDVDADCLRADNGSTCQPLTAEASAFFGRSGACGPSDPEPEQ